jgi:hypothetical protein
MKIRFLVLLLIAVSCNNPKSQKELQVVDTTLVMPKERAVSTSNVQKLLKDIMGTGEGLLRGVKFGDPISEVKKKETLELFEEEAEYVGYSFDTESLETVDILYMRDGSQKVNGVQVDIYMNTDASNDSLKTIMGNMFTTKYGKPTDNGEMQIWKIKPSSQVSIKAVKSKIDRGLEVRFSKNGSI